MLALKVPLEDYLSVDFHVFYHDNGTDYHLVVIVSYY
jgi:hypothetical protein